MWQYCSWQPSNKTRKTNTYTLFFTRKKPKPKINKLFTHPKGKTKALDKDAIRYNHTLWKKADLSLAWKKHHVLPMETVTPIPQTANSWMYISYIGCSCKPQNLMQCTFLHWSQSMFAVLFTLRSSALGATWGAVSICSPFTVGKIMPWVNSGKTGMCPWNQ